MSAIIDDTDHELVVRMELKEIRQQLQVMNMLLREAFNQELTTDDIEVEE